LGNHQSCEGAAHTERHAHSRLSAKSLS
jgi:hypothetical protein